MMTSPHKPKSWYGKGIPGVNLEELHGSLIVIEGADGSGRSSQIAMLNDWLEGHGRATVSMGLRRSNLISPELAKAKQGNVMGRITMNLFYTTDFMDQLENRIIPALRAGFIVLADRYIYTLLARACVRGIERKWIEDLLLGVALVPDAVFYLKVSPKNLVERNFEKHSALDYWESGMDIGLSQDIFDSFVKYQRRVQTEFSGLQERFGFEVINGNRSPRAVQLELQAKLAHVLGVE
ncbi:MAG TPA: thymidylate kinase [bacterium]|nr:thymidylate kinase [bacterium]